ncbi:hypothetical protein ACFLTI_05110 [Bacteroidota bacterium]
MLVIPVTCFSQNNYIKNPHVEINNTDDNEFYYFTYTFKDQWDISRNFNFKFPKDYTNRKIHKFGIPETLAQPFTPSEKAINIRKEIAKDGLFRINKNTIEIDKSAIVSFYAKDYGRPIANFIKEILEEKGADTRLQRIEMAMKFVQDIPYGIPNWEKNGNYYGGISTPPEILIFGYGDCDSKAFLFACILSYLIDAGDIVFVQQDQHLLTAVKINSVNEMSYIPINGDNYAIAETSGPARFNFGEIEQIEKNEIIAEKLVFHKDIDRLSSQPSSNNPIKLSSKIVVQKRSFYKLFFRNDYDEEIVILMHFQDIDGNWVTEGWYKIKSGETIHIASSRNKTFYYFARCQDGEWAGESFREFEGKTYGFNKIKNPQSSFADLIYVLTGNQ